MGFAILCEICNQGIEHGVSLTRTGGKGPGINPHWRCFAHLPADKIDPAVQEVVAAIESGSQPKH
jgi:hypothetical protein